MSRFLPMAAASSLPASTGPIPHAAAAAGDVHRFDTASASHVLLVNGSRVFTLAADIAASLDASPDPAALLASLGLSAPPYVNDEPPSDPPVRALSLAVSQACNLACTYCYAQGGSFGGRERRMPAAVALAAVERLFAGVPRGDSVNLAFLGGEPLVARDVLRQCTQRAAALAAAGGIHVGFSITTNGTLLTAADAAFFEQHGFAVTVSIDGSAGHDRLRPFKDGGSSYARVVRRVKPLLALQRQMQVSARVTVTPLNLHLEDTLDSLLALGFHSVGFSPMLASPTGSGEMAASNLETMLRQMIACGEAFEARVARGERYAFQNMASAMKEIHRGTHRPYPCGAGAGYFGVSAQGHLYACHRFVEDPAGAMGSLAEGVDRGRQRQWLTDRHVHRQEPCRSCWARYLCGGGCHHEVIARGRPACDYIRGWLHYCLQAYVRLLDVRPDYFSS
jgi:uncharacterized protein